MREHDRLVGAVGGRTVLLLERDDRNRAERDRPPSRLGLRSSDLVADELLADAQTAFEEVDVLPTQAGVRRV